MSFAHYLKKILKFDSIPKNMQSTRPIVLRLYRSLLKEGKKWKAYNFREYIVRTTKNSFQKYKNETDVNKIHELISKAERDLEVVKRQGLIQNMYTKDKIVLEINKK